MLAKGDGIPCLLKRKPMGQQDLLASMTMNQDFQGKASHCRQVLLFRSLSDAFRRTFSSIDFSMGMDFSIRNKLPRFNFCQMRDINKICE